MKGVAKEGGLGVAWGRRGRGLFILRQEGGSDVERSDAMDVGEGRAELVGKE